MLTSRLYMYYFVSKKRITMLVVGKVNSRDNSIVYFLTLAVALEGHCKNLLTDHENQMC